MLMQLLKILKLYMNCGKIAVMMGIILSVIGNFLSTAQKHNRQNFEHNRPGPSYMYSNFAGLIGFGSTQIIMSCASGRSLGFLLGIEKHL